MSCPEGQYFCNDRQKCMPIPKGKKVRKDGELVSEVAPPGWGHTKAEKEKTKPDKPKSKIGGSAAAFKRALDDGRFKGLPGDKTKKEKTASMFKLMWSMKKKGDKPHYKPGTDEKKKKYQDESWKPEIEHVKGSDLRKKAAEKKRKEAADSLPPHLRLDTMKKAFSQANEATTMQDNNLFGDAYATLKKKVGSKKKHDKPAVEEGIMQMVKRAVKKKDEKKPEKAMDAGARAKRKLARKVHAKYVSGSEDNVPDDIREGRVEKKKKKHNCASKVKHEEYGIGKCISGMHDLDENGNVAHYDVEFEEYIVEGVPVTSLEILEGQIHEHVIKETVKNGEVDLILKSGVNNVLKQDSKEYDRGLLAQVNEDGSYDVAYWYDKYKAYPVEVEIDGKTCAKDAKNIHIKFHPELKEDHYSGTGEKVAARTKKYMDKKGMKGAPGLDAMKARTAEHKAKRGVKEDAVLDYVVANIRKRKC